MDKDDPNGHGSLLTFGYIPKGAVNEIMHLAQTLPAVLPVTADRLTRTAYQNQFGIFQHSDVEKAHGRPLALVAYHPKEDLYEGGMKANYIRKFYHLKVGDAFNVSLTEFFDMEMADAEFMCEIAKAHIKQYEKTTNDVERQMNLELNQYK